MTTQHDDNEKALNQADDERCKAMLAGDLEALDRLLADELVYTHSSASVDNKSQYIEALRNRKAKYVAIERSNTRSSFYGDIALMHGQARIEVIVNDTLKNLNNLFQTVWIKRDGRWQLLAWASTVIPSAS